MLVAAEKTVKVNKDNKNKVYIYFILFFKLFNIYFFNQKLLITISYLIYL